MWKTDDTNNQTGWSNKDYDRLLAESAQFEDNIDRFAKMKEARNLA